MDFAKHLGKSLSDAQHTAQGKDFELILTLKVETRHPVGGPFGREFSAFVIIAELSRKLCEQFLRFFFETRPLSNCRYCTNSAKIYHI